MEEVKSGKLIDELRESRRVNLRVHQENNRLKAFDSNRLVESEILTEKDVVGLCSRIKRRKRATAEDLYKLSNAFIQSEKNVTEFMKVTGAINVLIKEFTGMDSRCQLLAAQCLCNLSLGDETCCSKVATFAGSYLMIFILKPGDIQLSKVCLWITQNIVASGPKPLCILLSQELLKNCLHILSCSAEQYNDSLQLLDLIIDGKWKELNEDEKREVRETLWSAMRKNFGDLLTLQVFLKVTASEPFAQEDTKALLGMLIANLKEESVEELVIHFSIKILVNLLQQDKRNLVQFLEILIESNATLSNIINTAAQNPKLFNVIKDLAQLLSIIFVSQQPEAIQYFNVDPIDNLRIPKILQL